MSFIKDIPSLKAQADTIIQLLDEIGFNESVNIELSNVFSDFTDYLLNVKSILAQKKLLEEEDIQLEEDYKGNTDEEEVSESEVSEEDNITMRTLYLRKKLILELNSTPVKQIKWFEFVLLELRQKMKTYKNTGSMYRYMIVPITHSRVFGLTDSKYNKKVRIQSYNIKYFVDHPIIKYCLDVFLQKESFNNMSVEKFLSDSENTENLLDYMNDLCYRVDYMNDLCYRVNLPKDFKKYTIKIRSCLGKMDLRETPIDTYSVLNLKRWNKNTMKASNKGLKANTAYTWYDSNNRKIGWKFEELDSRSLKSICEKNGLKLEKGQKYQYGDYANWFIKL